MVGLSSPDLGVPTETVPDPEETIAQIISKADAVFERQGMPRKAGECTGACGFSADLVGRATERLGAKGVTSETRQVMSIHSGLGLLTGDSKAIGFAHGVNVIAIGGQRRLVDISFCQFVDPVSGKIRQHNWVSPVNYKDSPVAQELIKTGNVVLTDESLREYLKITTPMSDTAYIDSATVESVLSNHNSLREDYEHYPEALDEYLDGKREANKFI